MRKDNHVIIRYELVLDVSNCVERSFRDLFDLNERGKPIYLLRVIIHQCRVCHYRMCLNMELGKEAFI